MIPFFSKKFSRQYGYKMKVISEYNSDIRFWGPTYVGCITGQKHALLFIKLFLQHGLPTLSKCFVGYSDRIQKVLKCLKETTRYLHRLCCHSKFIKNCGILAQIPFVREMLETLLVRVKELMVANNCASEDAWTIGNLKNKDLHGHIIFEQKDDSEDDEEDMPPPEEDDDDIDDDHASLIPETSGDSSFGHNTSSGSAASRIF